MGGWEKDLAESLVVWSGVEPGEADQTMFLSLNESPS